MTARWNPDFAAHALPFAALQTAAQSLAAPAWPTCSELNRVLAQRTIQVRNASGQALRFVDQAPGASQLAEKYEARIFLRGEIPYRTGGWHDVFNALAWMTFPRAKAALNACHYRALEHQQASGAANRTPLQDALTLFDESGVIVAASDSDLADLLRAHAWKELFWRRRAAVSAHMRFYLFGHGLAEKMLEPFTGITGRSLIFVTPQDFFVLPLADQLATLDKLIAARLASAREPLTSGELTPVPLLGIPGWCTANEDARYYDNTAYFRPRRSPF